MNEPFFKSYLLGRNFLLEDIKTLNNAELDTLNIETMAALEEARYQYARVDDKTTAEAGPVFARCSYCVSLELWRQWAALLMKG